MADKSQILIVEDDLDLSEMLNAYFRVQGYDVLTAAWGKDAVKMSREHNPDLVVLDIRLPDIDGYEVCRQLRTNRRTQDIPVIFLTEKRDRVDKLAGLELGVVDYITKPFDIQELRLRVRNSLRRAAQQQIVNPVTNVPEGQLVAEKMNELLQQDSRWAILTIGIHGLESFGDHYGFIASDDVLRAVTLMVNNAIREVGNESDFIGHLGPNEFVIITDSEHLPAIRERIEVRIKQSMEYFYPLKDRDEARKAMNENRLRLMVGQVLANDGPFDDLDALDEAINAHRSLQN
ncbi:MAG TPA: response regulator [Aggregatilineales bacterium]|nr:response regulator [Aggregatilineales bacterium]